MSDDNPPKGQRAIIEEMKEIDMSADVSAICNDLDEKSKATGLGTDIAADIIREQSARIEELEAANKAMQEALTPSGETKAAYISEVETTCPDGRPHFVDWTATKEIMAMIRNRATIEKLKGGDA